MVSATGPSIKKEEAEGAVSTDNRSPPQAVVRPSWAGKLQAETWHGRGQGRRKRLYEYSGGPPPVQRKAQSYREGSEFELSWRVHKISFLVAAECGRAVSHRSKLIEVL